MDGLTHVAAILLGVILTLLFARSFQKNDDMPPDSDITPTASRSTLRKKKKKKAKAVAAAAAAANSVEHGANPEVVVKDSGNQQKLTVTPDENQKTTVKKKKKKKKKISGGKVLSETVNEEKKAENIEKSTQQQQSGNNEAGKPRQKHEGEEWGVVTGPKKRKPKQKKTVQSTPSVLITAVSESLTVDAKKIGIIIGPKGATMKSLEDATGCKLDINAPSRDDQPAKTSRQQKAGVIISGGDKEGMAKAKKAILELASKGYATILQSENFGEFGSMVHPRYLSEIVGPGGKTIQAIQSEFDVKLTIPSTDWTPNSSQVGQVKPCKVGIAGSKENVKQAKAVIQSLVKYHHHEITHPGLVHEQVHVSQEFFHCVIGPRGSEIKHIRGNFKVDIYMPNECSFTDDILVVGKQSNVDRAISYIQTLIDRDSEQREIRYNDEYY